MDAIYGVYPISAKLAKKQKACNCRRSAKRMKPDLHSPQPELGCTSDNKHEKGRLARRVKL
ncbi:hypothetical protein EBB07_08205 [Paenibacillaceae bacterium]|nr:hypothetical protein EBB07_08205 [Paenibacillaceae bacterium]